MPKNQQGQTLIAVLMVMVIALSIGLAVSQRIIGGYSRSIKYDSSERALAAAEAALERVLTISTTTLDGYIANNNCGAACQVTITGADGLNATGAVTLAYAGNTSTEYTVKISKNQVFELALVGYPDNRTLELCWDNALVGENPSVSVLHVYGAAMPYSFSKYAYNSSSTNNASNGFSTAVPDLSYQSCFTLPARTSPRFVRVRALYNEVTLHVIPKDGASLPIQGYSLTSVGTFGTSSKTVKAIKSKPFLPSSYDFVLFSTSDDTSLSN